MFFLPEDNGDMKDSADEDDDHCQKEEKAKECKFPRVARSDGTHSLYRSTVDVTRTCAHVTNTAAVAVFLNSQNY